jgi:hypothetical protein
MEFSWGSLLTLAGTTGVITVLLNQGIGWLREWRASAETKKVNAGYLAIRVAVMLEEYADACATVVGDIYKYDLSRGNAGQHTTVLPMMPEYPDDDESWRTMDPGLMERCLSFPGKVAASQRAVHDFAEFASNEEEVSQRCLEKSCARGLEAWHLAADLRKRFGFPSHSPIYDYVGFLRERAKGVAEQCKRQEANAEGCEEMEARMGGASEKTA